MQKVFIKLTSCTLKIGFDLRFQHRFSTGGNKKSSIVFIRWELGST